MDSKKAQTELLIGNETLNQCQLAREFCAMFSRMREDMPSRISRLIANSNTLDNGICPIRLWKVPVEGNGSGNKDIAENFGTATGEPTPKEKQVVDINKHKTVDEEPVYLAAWQLEAEANDPPASQDKEIFPVYLFAAQYGYSGYKSGYSASNLWEKIASKEKNCLTRILEIDTHDAKDVLALLNTKTATLGRKLEKALSEKKDKYSPTPAAADDFKTSNDMLAYLNKRISKNGKSGE